MRLLFWIIALPLFFVGALFAVANRDVVPIDLWPFAERVTAPLYLALGAAFYLGFVVGGVVSWLAGRRRRAEGRRAQWRAAQLSREKADLEARLARRTEAAASTSALPAPARSA
jgi:lipopolysaccharide assembly protein A